MVLNEYGRMLFAPTVPVLFTSSLHALNVILQVQLRLSSHILSPQAPVPTLCLQT